MKGHAPQAGRGRLGDGAQGRARSRRLL